MSATSPKIKVAPKLEVESELTVVESEPTTLTENQRSIDVKWEQKDGTVVTSRLVIDTQIKEEFTNVLLAEKEAGSKYVKVARYIIKHKTPRKVLINTLLALGKTESSANSIASRVIALAKPENEELRVLIEKGQIGDREARQILALKKNPVKKAPRSHESLMVEALLKAANYAVSEGFDFNRFVEEAQKAYDIETSNAEAKAQAAALAAQEAATKAAVKEVVKA